MTDVELIYNHTIFHAYLCYLVDIDQADSIKELCELSWQLDQEIKIRRISDSQVKECIKNANLDPQDQLMISKYIYPEIDLLSSKAGQS